MGVGLIRVKSRSSPRLKLLRGRLCWRFGLLAVTTIEAINAPGRVHKLLLARKERVTGGADFDVQVVLARRVCLEGLAAGAGDCDFVVLWMDSLLHNFLSADRRESVAPGKSS